MFSTKNGNDQLTYTEKTLHSYYDDFHTTEHSQFALKKYIMYYRYD